MIALKGSLILKYYSPKNSIYEYKIKIVHYTKKDEHVYTSKGILNVNNKTDVFNIHKTIKKYISKIEKQVLHTEEGYYFQFIKQNATNDKKKDRHSHSQKENIIFNIGNDKLLSSEKTEIIKDISNIIKLDSVPEFLNNLIPLYPLLNEDFKIEIPNLIFTSYNKGNLAFDALKTIFYFKKDETNTITNQKLILNKNIDLFFIRNLFYKFNIINKLKQCNTEEISFIDDKTIIFKELFHPIKIMDIKKIRNKNLIDLLTTLKSFSFKK